MPAKPTLTEAAVRILATADPAAKAAAVSALAESWRHGAIGGIGSTRPPDRPARPARPELRPPRQVPRRRIAADPRGRIALLHALAHIELNAIDLAVDIAARFAHADLPTDFYGDWLAVGADEARHYLMLSDRLAELDASYGDLPAHDGLWQAAEATAADLMARLAVVPLVLEARGLDVTPAMIARLRAVGDDRSAEILQIIHDEEIRHVATGVRWFRFLCAGLGREPAPTYHALVRRHFSGRIKPPFNTASRDAAGLSVDFYEPLTGI